MSLPPLAGPERERAILDAVRRGEHCPIQWTAVPCGRVTLSVATDALRIEGVRANVTAETAQRLADLLGCVMPTPRICDAVHRAAVVVVAPQLGAPDAHMVDTSRMVEHSRRVDAAIGGRPGLVSTVGKEWVICAALLRSAGAVNHGWHAAGAPSRSRGGLALWQAEGTRHNAQHTDYSQVFRPVSRRCLLDGAPADLEDVLRGPAASEVSYDGRLAVTRQPGVGFSAAVEAAPGPAARDTLPAPPPRPFIQARNCRSGRTADVRVVVLHTTEGDLRPGAARAVASWFASANAPQASAHYIVDAGEVVQGVREEDTAFAAPGANHDGIQIEIVGRAGWPRERWLGEARAVIDRAGALVGEVCRRHGLPIELLTTEELAAGREGIATHASVSRAYRRSTHWDPGPGFPFDVLLEVAARE